MFGRLLRVEVFQRDYDTAGHNSTVLVDPYDDNCLKCSGTIEYLPTSSGAPRCTLQIYNLPRDKASKIFQLKSYETDEKGVTKEVENPIFIQISFGYRDENNGELSKIFVGQIAKAFTTRYDSTTTVTKIYAYSLASLFTSAFTSLNLEPTDEDGNRLTVYDAVNKIFENSTYPGIVDNFSKSISSEVAEEFKKSKITAPLSYYQLTLDALGTLLKEANLQYDMVVSPSGYLNFVKRYPTGSVSATVLADVDEDRKIKSMSGLIGIPGLDTDGMRFSTLINPTITLYSYVYLPAYAISDNRDGFPGETNTQFGASYDPAGLYRITKMTTHFDSHKGDCKTDYVAMSAGSSLLQ